MQGRVATWALIAGIALAGCVAGGREPAGESADGGAFALEGETAPGTGGIAGIVVDEAIRPLGGVPVHLATAADSPRLTSPDGVFHFDDLVPGVHFLRIDAFEADGKRYLPMQISAEAIEGETTTMRIVLTARPPEDEPPVTLKFDGFYQVGNGFVDEVLDLFLFNRTYGPVTTPPNPNCICRFGVHTDSNVATFVLDLYWPATTVPAPAPGSWAIFLEAHPIEQESGALMFCRDGSPCNHHVQQAANYTATARDFDLGVWTDQSWVTVNQRFQLVVSMFATPAPPGWTFSPA